MKLPTANEDKTDDIYCEENDPETPYLNPEYRIDLYENTCGDLVGIVFASIGFVIFIFCYFLIFFLPVANGKLFKEHMWWTFLIFFVVTVAVLFSLI